MPRRDVKITAYEGGIRTPLIARWLSVIRDHGKMTSQPGHVIDFMATFLDIAGVEYPVNSKAENRNRWKAKA
ncbi:MAG: sulfatase-like hydrolase/transferase [Fuerstiella sp.]|nr:sulfatase-like hydrolase/transferase [Fuerstiella sp.]